MTSAWWFVIGWGSGMMTAVCVAFVLVGVILCGEADEESPELPKVNLVPTGVSVGEVEMGTPSDFAVAGQPRRAPWHIRKRELEAAAKTKRKKLESFQEFV